MCPSPSFSGPCLLAFQQRGHHHPYVTAPSTWLRPPRTGLRKKQSEAFSEHFGTRRALFWRLGPWAQTWTRATCGIPLCMPGGSRDPSPVQRNREQIDHQTGDAHYLFPLYRLKKKQNFKYYKICPSLLKLLLSEPDFHYTARLSVNN